MQTHVVEGEPLKFYHLILQQDLLDGWVVIREWGYQGVRGKTRREIYQDYEEAQRVLLNLRDQQLNRGYRVVFMSGGEHSKA